MTNQPTGPHTAKTDPLNQLRQLKTSLTYPQLSKLTGISEPTLVRWLLGTSNPSQANLRILSQAIK